MAFVIPAFKDRFFSETLDSLAKQSCQEFRVYIGDDASTGDLQRIAALFQKRLDLYYHRFDDHLGTHSLVKHWERCVALSSEPYFCLLGDDDVLHPDCVAGFYTAMRHSNKAYDVYRFSSAVIDSRGELAAYTAAPTRPESSEAFLLARLHFRRVSFIASYVIRRDAYLREGGFIEFPLAWFSDDASIIVFSESSGIANINGPPVYWRLSNENISAPNRDTYLKKTDATLKYIKWLSNRFRYRSLGAMPWSSERCKELMENYFFRHMGYSGGYPIGFLKSLSIAIGLRPYCRSNIVSLFLRLCVRNRYSRKIRPR